MGKFDLSSGIYTHDSETTLTISFAKDNKKMVVEKSYASAVGNATLRIINATMRQVRIEGIETYTGVQAMEPTWAMSYRCGGISLAVKIYRDLEPEVVKVDFINQSSYSIIIGDERSWLVRETEGYQDSYVEEFDPRMFLGMWYDVIQNIWDYRSTYMYTYTDGIIQQIISSPDDINKNDVIMVKPGLFSVGGVNDEYLGDAINYIVHSTDYVNYAIVGDYKRLEAIVLARSPDFYVTPNIYASIKNLGYSKIH